MRARYHGLALRLLLQTAMASPLMLGLQPARAQEIIQPIRSIVLLPNAAEVRQNGAAPPPVDVDASRVPVLAAPKAQAAIRKFIGLPFNAALLDSLREAIGEYYAGIDRPFVVVAVPEQDFTNGVLQLVVLESTLGKVSVEGNRWFDSSQYLDKIRLRPGGPIANSVLQGDIDWINRNPARHVTALTAAGEAPGTTDITLQAQDRDPLSFNLGADNTGNPATGFYRLYAGFEWADALGLGDDFTYRFTTSGEPRLLQQHSASYVAYLPWRDVLAVSGAIADSETDSAGSPISSGGRTAYAALRYQHDLRRVGRFTHGVSLGFDFKSTNNNILFGGTSVFSATSEIDQFLLTYSGQVPDGWGSTDWQAQLVYSPGGLTGLNNDAAFQAQQAGARANYVYGNAVAERITGLTDSLSWYVRGSVQYAGGILLPSEQMSFGGASNRAFATIAATRDNGVQLTNELRFSGLAPGLPAAFGSALADQLVPYLFLDYGAGWDRRVAGGGNNWMSMLSLGAGFNYALGRYGLIGFSYGLPLERTGLVGQTLRPQFSVSLNF